MENVDPFSEFVEAVEDLHDDGPVRITAHTSNASAHGWNTSRSSRITEASAHEAEQ